MSDVTNEDQPEAPAEEDQGVPPDEQPETGGGTPAGEAKDPTTPSASTSEAPSAEHSLGAQAPLHESSPAAEPPAAEAPAAEAPAAEAPAAEAPDAERPAGDSAAEASQSTEQETASTPDGGVKQVGRPPGGAGRKIRMYWPVAALAFCTLALVVGLTVALRNTNSADPKPDENAAAAGGLELFRDEQAGFTIRYPKSWRRIPIPPEAQDLRLVLSANPDAPGNDPANPPGGADGMWIRAFPQERINQKINEFAAELQALTGGQPCGAEGSPCLRQEQVTVGGLTGARYVYITKDEVSGQNSVHLQYFLRRPEGKLYVLVFQAMPMTDLEGLAPVFDQVLFSFQAIEEGTGPAASTTTTAAR